jgi:hypothetical protein
MQGVGVPAGDSQLYLHGHHSLGSVTEMVAMAASATVSNVVGMIGTVSRHTEVGLSVQIAAKKVQRYVPPINVLPTGCQPSPVTVFFLLASISSTRQMRRSSRRRTYISLACDAFSLSPTASRVIPSLSTTPSRSKNHPRVQPGPLDPTALPETEPARAGPQTVCTMLNAGWPALLAAHSFLLTSLFSVTS